MAGLKFYESIYFKIWYLLVFEIEDHLSLICSCKVNMKDYNLRTESVY